MMNCSFQSLHWIEAKALVAIIVAGGWVAVIIILVIILLAVVVGVVTGEV